MSWMPVDKVRATEAATHAIPLVPAALPVFTAAWTLLLPPRTDSGTHQQRSVLDWYLEVG